MASSHITSWLIHGEQMETVTDFIFLASKITWTVTAVKKFKDTCSLEEKLCKPRKHIQKQKHHFADKSPYNQNYALFCFVFPSSHEWM